MTTEPTASLSDHSDDEEFVYTQEPVRGHLFVGAITDEMIERAARAIVNYDCNVHAAPQLRDDQPLDAVNNPDAYRDRARVALTAALRQSQTSEEMP